MSLRNKLRLTALAVGLLTLAAIFYAGSSLTAPAPSHVGAPPLDFPGEEVKFDSDSGSRIHAWWIPGTSDKATVVLAHSLRANRREMIGRARFLHAAGYSLLLYDAQAHGESPGERITFGFLEAHDAHAAVAFARARNAHVAYLGQSLGGAAALLGAEPLPVDALILESVYPTLREATHSRIAIRLGPLANVLVRLLLFQVKPRIGVEASTIAPINSISEVSSPLLIIAGELDQHTPLAQSRRMFAAASAPKTLWIVPDAAHVNYHRARPAEYERRILEFLNSAGL